MCRREGQEFYLRVAALALASSPSLEIKEPQTRFELATCWLRNSCATFAPLGLYTAILYPKLKVVKWWSNRVRFIAYLERGWDGNWENFSQCQKNSWKIRPPSLLNTLISDHSELYHMERFDRVTQCELAELKQLAQEFSLFQKAWHQVRVNRANKRARNGEPALKIIRLD